jgi:hypothetical protein
MTDDCTRDGATGDEFFGSESFELLICIDAVMASIDVLDDYLDPRRRRAFLRAVVDKLEEHIPVDDSPLATEGGQLEKAVHHTFAHHWATATGELGEFARMAQEYGEAVTMFRKSMRVWNGFSSQSRLDMAVVLSYVAALDGQEEVCLEALALCDGLGGSPTQAAIQAAARQHAAVNFAVLKGLGAVDELVARLQA